MLSKKRSSHSHINRFFPGWYLNLNVPKTDETAGILPRSPSFPLLQENLSELCSAPGRQAASLVRSTHLRSLEVPLSAIGTATSLAETNPSMIAKGMFHYFNNNAIKGTRLTFFLFLLSNQDRKFSTIHFE